MGTRVRAASGVATQRRSVAHNPRAVATNAALRCSGAAAAAALAASANDAARVLRRGRALQDATTGGTQESVVDAAARLSLLEGRLQLRRLYRKVLVAQLLLDAQRCASGAQSDSRACSRLTRGAPLRAPRRAPPPEGGDEGDAALDADEALLDKVAQIERMQQTAASLQAALAQLRGRGLKVLFGDDSAAAEAAMRARVDADFEALTKGAAACLATLPHRSLAEARAAAEASLARRRDAADETGSVLRLGVGGQATRVKAELELLREQPLEVMQDVAEYSRGVWARLNGRAPRSTQAPALAGMPLPAPTRAAREARMVELALDAEAADAALTEAARGREAALKRRDPLGLPLAREIRELDAAVRDARAVLAVRTLQLEAERIYAALEEEATEVTDAGAARDAELAVLVAEFGVLDAALADRARLVGRGEAALVADDELDVLVRDIADLKTRLGISEDGGAGKDLSLGMLAEKCARSVRETGAKVTDGAEFLSRGVRLLGEDVTGSLSLVSRTLSGSTLKPREVQALRRTSRDLLTFIPFIIILIVPITPVGHVLVFSFLQRYFPGFFPSQFSSRRQELFRRFEGLRRELQEAEETAVAATEAAALKRAAEVVAALTRGESSPGFADLDETPPGVADLQERANKVAEAVLAGDDGEEQDGVPHA